ncbi:hypothetical protein BH20BAC1_BH20BAC1_03330 [soil metagenome]
MHLETIRGLLIFFIIALIASGITAIPIDTELKFLIGHTDQKSFVNYWFRKVLLAYRDTKIQYPFLLYGYDWLAFAHFILAILFIGPLKNPVKNIWVVEFGMIACVLVFPLALVARHFRGIPPGWRLIDCSFGLAGIIPLWICRIKISKLDKWKN